MKKIFFIGLVIFCLFISLVNAQSYSVSITSGGNIAGSPVS